MAYKVNISELPFLELKNSDFVFEIRQNEQLLGCLNVSKGHVVWRPANYSYGYWLNWYDFGEVLKEKGTRRKVNY